MSPQEILTVLTQLLNHYVSKNDKANSKRIAHVIQSETQNLFKTPKRVDPNAVTDEEIAMAKNGQRIQAIKSYRARTGASLKQALDAIDPSP